MRREDFAAERVRLLAGRDAFGLALGFELVEGGQGFATVAMVVRPEHLNFNGTCHGGVIFSLADSAFGLASNSHGLVGAGIDAHITYHVAVQAGDRLIASAREISRSRKLSVCRVEVSTHAGKAVSGFTGTVYVTAQPHTSHPRLEP